MNATDKAKKIQMIVIGGIAVVGISIVAFIASQIKEDATDPEAAKYEWGFKPDEENIAQSKYVNKVGDDVKGIETETKNTQRQLEDTQTQLKQLQEQMKSMQNGNGGLKPPPQLNSAPQNRSLQGGFLNGLYDKYPAPANVQPAPINQVAQQQQTLPLLAPPPPIEKPVYVFEYESGSISGGSIGENVEVNATGKSEATGKEKKRIFVPSTTQVKVVLINGFNAPTLRNGQNVKAPVMVKAVDNMMLPNGKRMDFKSCNFQGEAFGKLSDNRAYPRMTTMACIDKNNHPVELPITAYITDEFGNDGLEGTPVTLQNKLIENALWASAIAGFSNIASQRNTLLTTTALGSTSTQSSSMGDQFQSGIFGGIAKTGGKLEDFLFDNIKAIETVIQVKGRRNLVLHFTTGFYVYEDGSNYENVKIQTITQSTDSQHLGVIK